MRVSVAGSRTRRGRGARARRREPRRWIIGLVAAVGLSSGFHARTRATGHQHARNRLTNQCRQRVTPDADLAKRDSRDSQVQSSASALVTARDTTATVRHLRALPNYPLWDQGDAHSTPRAGPACRSAPGGPAPHAAPDNPWGPKKAVAASHGQCWLVPAVCPPSRCPIIVVYVVTTITKFIAAPGPLVACHHGRDDMAAHGGKMTA